MLDLLKKVNAEISLFLSDNHGFPMSFLAGTPCLSERRQLLVTTIKNINLPAQESEKIYI